MRRLRRSPLAPASRISLAGSNCARPRPPPPSPRVWRSSLSVSQGSVSHVAAVRPLEAIETPIIPAFRFAFGGLARVRRMVFTMRDEGREEDRTFELARALCSGALSSPLHGETKVRKG